MEFEVDHCRTRLIQGGDFPTRCRRREFPSLPDNQQPAGNGEGGLWNLMSRHDGTRALPPSPSPPSSRWWQANARCPGAAKRCRSAAEDEQLAEIVVTVRASCAGTTNHKAPSSPSPRTPSRTAPRWASRPPCSSCRSSRPRRMRNPTAGRPRHSLADRGTGRRHRQSARPGDQPEPGAVQRPARAAGEWQPHR